jgi:hypothetical protein
MLKVESRIEQFVDLVGGVVKEITFKETKPNLILIRNNSDYSIYLSESIQVSTTSYMKLVPDKTSKKYTTVSGLLKIYLYSGNNISNLQIISCEDPEMSVSDMDEDTSINSTIGSVTITTLPAGSNTIGKVGLIAGTELIGKVKLVDTAGTNELAIDGSGNIGVALGGSLPAGTNNIGDVDVVTLPALAAGTNNIGDVDVLTMPPVKILDAAGTNQLVVEADGSINVNGATFTGTIGTVKLENSAGTNELEIEADGSLNVNLAAGTNNIGDVDILTVAAGQNLKPMTTPAVYNVTCTTAGTEYSQALAAGCKYFMIGIKSKDDTVTWELKFGTGGTSKSFNGSETVEISNLLLASQTLYFETDKDGEIIEIIDFS